MKPRILAALRLFFFALAAVGGFCAAALMSGCDRPPTAPEGIAIEVRDADNEFAGIVVYHAGPCDPRPVEVVDAVLRGLARAKQERADASLGRLVISGVGAGPAEAYYPGAELMEYRCGYESVLEHGMGHHVAARIGLNCGRAVWHTRNLWCEVIPS